MKNRKFIVFVLGLASIVAMTILGHPEGNNAAVMLTLGLFAANVVQKNEHFNGDK